MAYSYHLTAYIERPAKNSRARKKIQAEEIYMSGFGDTSLDAAKQLIHVIEAENPQHFDTNRHFCEEVNGGYLWWSDKFYSDEELSSMTGTCPVRVDDPDTVDYYLHDKPAEPTFETIEAFALEVLSARRVMLVVGKKTSV